MQVLRVFDRLLDHIETAVVALGLTVGVVATFLEVILRYVFGSSTGWGGELTNFAIIWAAMVGAAAGIKSGIHIGIDVWVRRFPPPIFKAVVLFGIGLSGLFTAAVTWLGVELVLFSMGTGQVTAEMLIPRWIPYSSVPVGMGLMTLHLAQQFVRRLRMSGQAILDELKAAEVPEGH